MAHDSSFPESKYQWEKQENRQAWLHRELPEGELESFQRK
jgi:hypothetical protein